MSERPQVNYNRPDSDDIVFLWEFFAAHALAGLLAGPSRGTISDSLPRMASEYADAMMAERAKRRANTEGK